MQQAETPWIVLRITSRVDGLWAAYKDDTGRVLEPPSVGEVPADWMAVPLAPPFPPAGNAPRSSLLAPNAMFIPTDLQQHIRDQSQFGVGCTVFVDPPPGTEIWPWESAVGSILDSPLSASVVVARLARPTWSERLPFQLPIRILPVSLSSLAALEPIRKASWYVQQPHVRAYGLHIGFSEVDAIDQSLTSGDGADIVIAPARDARTLINAIDRIKQIERRPRLLVIFGAVPNEWELASLRVPEGLSLIRTPIGDNDARRFVEEIVFAVIHDQPLHDALAQARRATGASGILISDPAGVHDLRISLAARGVIDDATTLDRVASVGDIPAFVERLGPTAPAAISETLQAAAPLEEAVRSRAKAARDHAISFDRESTGLAPLSKLLAERLDAQAERRRLESSLLSLALDPEASRIVEQHQRRVVDLTFDALNRGVYRPLGTRGSLQPGQPCRMAVTIGHRSEHTLFATEPPPIDPLLPDPGAEDGHPLEIVLFEKNFSLRSPRVQRAYLPRLGALGPVYFELRAPVTNGPADLRVSIYHDNYLLQSFAVESHVGPMPATASGTVTVAHLDFSETDRFTNLDSLEDRILSVAVNAERDGRTHSIFVKKDGEASAPLSITQKVMEDQVSAFRAMLLAASAIGVHPRFEMDPGDDAKPTPDFENVVRQFAEFGKDLSRMLTATSSPELDAMLDKVTDTSDRVIQVARHDDNFVFPWQVVYDYPLPPPIQGAPPRPVCVGKPLRALAALGVDEGARSLETSARNAVATLAPMAAQAAIGCPHNPGMDVCCIYGFWGVRHRLEQLTGASTTRDRRPTIVKVSDRAAVCAATAATDDDAKGVIAALHEKLGEAFAELPLPTGIDELMWDPKRRPSVLLVLGHLETNPIDGEPKGPRIALVPPARRASGLPLPPGKWLHAGYLIDWKKTRKAWTGEPRALVLLVSCSSGDTKVDTLNNLVKSLDAVGAAAVVATECPVHSRLVARFAREVVADLWNNKTRLGEALQKFGRKLMIAGNPLGFVFSSVGSADLQFVEKN